MDLAVVSTRELSTTTPERQPSRGVNSAHPVTAIRKMEAYRQAGLRQKMRYLTTHMYPPPMLTLD